MVIDSDDLERILVTFTDPDFAPAIATLRRLVGMGKVSISRTSTAAPTGNLRATYSRSASNPRLRHAVAQQCERLAEIASMHPDERWYILIVAIGEDPQVTIFSNENGVGRVCINYTVA